MTSPGIYQLFVYGSLRSHFRSPAYEYIARYFNLTGEGTVPGKIFDMGEYPAAIPVNDGSVIIGELYTIKNEREFAWAICQLDDYEGVHVEAHELPLYRREIIQVNIEGSAVPAWIYWFNGDVTGKPFVASGDMVDYQKARQTTGSDL
jgi:gamma-glutamylcyclotransferase (GGCT)/AIG2-like uncharacterized protein YtfP